MKPELIYPIWNEWHSAYSQEHRHHHVAGHIFYMFEKAIFYGIELSSSEILAIWLHDYVYDIGSNTNEEDSSLFAKTYIEDNDSLMREHGVIMTCVVDMIMATRGDDQGQSLYPGLIIDVGSVVDLDLWILSEREREYATYVSNIALEYLPACKSLDEFMVGRATFIDSMLSRDSIFTRKDTPLYIERNARCNLRSEMETMNDPDEYVMKYKILTDIIGAAND